MKKTAIVTGGSRGIGYAVAKQLGLDGCQVVIFSLEKQESCQEALDELTKLGIEWHYIEGSIDSPEDEERQEPLFRPIYKRRCSERCDRACAEAVRGALL